LTPVALKSLQEEVEHEAGAIVGRLCAKGWFGATGERATCLPLTSSSPVATTI
jgi:hypothetical protein